MPHKTRVVFIPFAGRNLKQQLLLQSWPLGRYQIAPYTGGVIDSIRGLSFIDELYVYGHGGAGEDFLRGEPEDGKRAEDVRYEELANRLERSGLPKSFGGRIKIYACESADVAKGGVWSLAKKFAVYMYNVKHYWLCSFWGYEGKITLEYKEGMHVDDGVGVRPYVEQSQAHKYSREVRGIQQERASARRERFYGVF